MKMCFGWSKHLHDGCWRVFNLIMIKKFTYKTLKKEFLIKISRMWPQVRKIGGKSKRYSWNTPSLFGWIKCCLWGYLFHTIYNSPSCYQNEAIAGLCPLQPQSKHRKGASSSHNDGQRDISAGTEICFRCGYQQAGVWDYSPPQTRECYIGLLRHFWRRLFLSWPVAVVIAWRLGVRDCVAKTAVSCIPSLPQPSLTLSQPELAYRNGKKKTL